MYKSRLVTAHLVLGSRAKLISGWHGMLLAATHTHTQTPHRNRDTDSGYNLQPLWLWNTVDAGCAPNWERSQGEGRGDGGVEVACSAPLREPRGGMRDADSPGSPDLI